MIQLVASDIDGTLLQGGAAALPEEVFDMIRALQKAGIRFCASSGRQYSSLRRLFAPVADEIYYICENGAAVFGPGKNGALLGKTVMERSLAEKLAEEIVARKDCEVLVSGINTSYLMPKEEEIVKCIRDFAGNNITYVHRVQEIPEDIIKVSAFCTPNPQLAEQELAPRWEKHFHAAVAGEQWLDFTLSDKGTGLDTLCHALQLSPKDIMVFGDNFNDAPILKKAGFPVLMETAHPALKEQFPVQCGNVPQYVREHVL